MKDKYELVASYIGVIFHFLIEDKLDFEFCAGIIKQDTLIDISGEEVEEHFKEFFRREAGISPYTLCPFCGGETIPCKNNKGYFIGCSNYPKCGFLASKIRKFSSKEEYIERIAKEAEVIEQAKALLKVEGETLYKWIQGNIKFVVDEKSFIENFKENENCINYGIAKKVLTIYKKAKNLGYPEKKPELYRDKVTDSEDYISKQIDRYYNYLKRDNPSITRDEAKQEYANLYKNNYGISFTDPCPNCNSALSLRRHRGYRYNSKLDHFIGCTNYPKCDFFANTNHRYLMAEEREKECEIINKVLHISSGVWDDLCTWLETQRNVESKKKYSNWYSALNTVKAFMQVYKSTYVTITLANKLLNILEKAIALGFECRIK